MALLLDESKKGKEIHVIAFQDGSVKCDRDAYKRYIDTFDEDEPDESILKLDGEPTRFVLTTSLDYGKGTNLQRKELRVIDGKTEVSGTYLAEEMRLSFINVINPPDTPKSEMIKFKKDGSGGAMIAFMDSLQRAGILKNLNSAWILARGRDQKIVDGELTEDQEKKT
jgi:hypothetical protein